MQTFIYNDNARLKFVKDHEFALPALTALAKKVLKQRKNEHYDLWESAWIGDVQFDINVYDSNEGIGIPDWGATAYLVKDGSCIAEKWIDLPIKEQQEETYINKLHNALSNLKSLQEDGKRSMSDEVIANIEHDIKPAIECLEALLLKETRGD